jgi:hypothetical protein
MNTRYPGKIEKGPILFPAILFHIHVPQPVINRYRSKSTAPWGEKLLLMGARVGKSELL